MARSGSPICAATRARISIGWGHPPAFFSIETTLISFNPGPVPRAHARVWNESACPLAGCDCVLLLSQKKSAILLLETKMAKPKTEVQQGTLALMVLKTLDVLGPVHGYGIARRIEQISGDLLAVNQGTLYPVLLKLEQEGAIASAWGTSENNRRARFYRLTRAGRRQLRTEAEDWEQTSAIIARFFAAKAEDLA
jgi:PadR family transcriptional regulator PadR